MQLKDSTYHDELFNFGGVWDKYAWHVQAHGKHPQSALFTAEHHLHRQRRAPLNSFFSKTRVAKHLDTNRRHIARLTAILDEFAAADREIDVGAAVSAWQRDISTEFLLNDQPDNLGEEDLGKGITTFIEAAGLIWRRTKHFRWYAPLMMSIPRDFMKKYSGDAGLVAWVKQNEVSFWSSDQHSRTATNSSKSLENHTRRLMDEAAKSSPEREKKVRQQ